MAKCAVYELYDGQDRLLYVGMSVNPVKRWEEHELNSEWSFGVAFSKVDWFASTEEARREEAYRIRHLHPIFNKWGNNLPGESPEWWVYYQEHKAHAAWMASNKRVSEADARWMAKRLAKADKARKDLQELMSA
jgi:hypothetical protein